MPTDVRIALLVAGAALLLAALVTTVLKRLPSAARVLMGVCGVGLLAWGIAQQLLLRPVAAPASAGIGAPPAASPAGAQPLMRPDLVLLASSAYADCARPGDPADPPDGNSASRAQMLAAQQAMTSFDAATTAYARCVDAATQHIVEQYQQFVPASELSAVRALDARVHNDAVDEDQVLVTRFNEQLRIFKAKQPAAKQSAAKTPQPASN